jgi:hypothetical protein
MMEPWLLILICEAVVVAVVNLSLLIYGIRRDRREAMEDLRRRVLEAERDEARAKLAGYQPMIIPNGNQWQRVFAKFPQPKIEKPEYQPGQWIN